MNDFTAQYNASDIKEMTKTHIYSSSFTGLQMKDEIHDILQNTYISIYRKMGETMGDFSMITYWEINKIFQATWHN